jgi:radical SAM protein with 4Fe4S-binding SPASM domain
MPSLIKVKDKPFIRETPAKFVVQVSYDGNPLHDKNRLTKQGNRTSPIVKNAIQLLVENDINFGLKSTLPWDGFKYLPEIWEDIRGMREEFGNNIAYSVTVDYHNVDFYSRKREVELAILEIARKEINFFREHEGFLSNIFRNDRAYCATAKSMAAIDTKGQVFYCHGCLYSKDAEDFKYASIYDKNFVEKIRETHERFYNNDVEPEECQNCVATMCLRCNVTKYQASQIEDHVDRWFDYTSERELCDYYQMVGKIRAALINITLEEE